MMKTAIATDKQYKKWIVELKNKIQTAQIKAAITVNRECRFRTMVPPRTVLCTFVFYQSPYYGRGMKTLLSYFPMTDYSSNQALNAFVHTHKLLDRKGHILFTALVSI